MDNNTKLPGFSCSCGNMKLPSAYLCTKCVKEIQAKLTGDK